MQRKQTAAALKLLLSCGGITNVCRLASIALPHLLQFQFLFFPAVAPPWVGCVDPAEPSLLGPWWNPENPEVRTVGTGDRKADSSAFVLGSCSSVIRLERLRSGGERTCLCFRLISAAAASSASLRRGASTWLISPFSRRSGGRFRHRCFPQLSEGERVSFTSFLPSATSGVRS